MSFEKLLRYNILRNVDYYNKHTGKDGSTESNCLNTWNELLDTIAPHIWKIQLNILKATKMVLQRTRA